MRHIKHLEYQFRYKLTGDCSRAFLILFKSELSEISDDNIALSNRNAESSHLENEIYAMWLICYVIFSSPSQFLLRKQDFLYFFDTVEDIKYNVLL